MCKPLLDASGIVLLVNGQREAVVNLHKLSMRTHGIRIK